MHVALLQDAADWPTFAVTTTRKTWSAPVLLDQTVGNVSVPFVGSAVKPGGSEADPTSSALTSETKSMPVGRVSNSFPR